MRILALDPGVRTGWARSDFRMGVLDLSKVADRGEAIARFEAWLETELTNDRPDLVMVERAIFSGRRRGAEFTMGLMMSAHAVAWSHKIPRREKTANEVRQLLTGDSRAKDGKMRAAVSLHGYHTTVSHQIDAAALLIAGMAA